MSLTKEEKAFIEQKRKECEYNGWLADYMKLIAIIDRLEKEDTELCEKLYQEGW